MRGRVLIVDDHAATRHVLRRILTPEFDVVGEAERLQPDVVVLDVSMPVMGGFEAAELLRDRVPGARIIFTSQHADPIYSEEAERVGGRRLPAEEHDAGGPYPSASAGD